MCQFDLLPGVGLPPMDDDVHKQIQSTRLLRSVQIEPANEKLAPSPEQAEQSKCISEEAWTRAYNLPLPFSFALFANLQDYVDPMIKCLLGVEARSIEMVDRTFRPFPRAFRRRSIPSISYSDYLARIIKYVSNLEPTVFLLLLIYSERLLHDGVRLDERAIHRFIVATICLGTKAMCDHYYSNEFYARVGGISTAELDLLELELAFLLNWHLQCSPFQLKIAWNHFSNL